MSGVENSTELASVEQAVNAFTAGQFVIIVDDEDRENEGDLVIAADHISPGAINFMATHGRGLICVAMQGALLDRLQIPLMVPQQFNRSGFGTGFSLSVEAATGVTTGISAADRAQTIKTLVDPRSTPRDIVSPGHVFPLRADDQGVLNRRGQTEASVDLAKLSKLTPAAVICEVMSEDGSMARLPQLLQFAAEHNICVISVAALVDYHQRAAAAAGKSVPAVGHTATEVADSLKPLVTKIGSSQLPIEQGLFQATVFRDMQGLEHTAMVMGDLADATPLVRLHSECLTGDAFGSLRCDCGAQLQTSLKLIAEEGNGILLYLRQEGRGIGLGNKIRAYALQETGVDTVDANEQLGFPADGREYNVAAAMLSHLGVNAIRLLTNNPEKCNAMVSYGIRVEEQIPLIIPAHQHNIDYLQTKAERMGHVLPYSEPIVKDKFAE